MWLKIILKVIFPLQFSHYLVMPDVITVIRSDFRLYFSVAKDVRHVTPTINDQISTLWCIVQRKNLQGNMSHETFFQKCTRNCSVPCISMRMSLYK